jgi:acyl carrier protein
MDQKMLDTLPTIRNFIEENFLFGQYTLKDNDSFLESGVLDSTGVLQLISFLGDSFGVTVADEEMIPDNLDSIDKIAAFLNRKQGGTAPTDGHPGAELAHD